MQLHISHQLSTITPISFWPQWMGTMQHWLTTATPLNLRRSFLKPEHWVQIFRKYVSASNIRPALPSYMICFISLLSSHSLWASPRASRGSAIHVFLVISNYWIRLSYHLKNYGDRGGCYQPRRITPQRSSLFFRWYESWIQELFYYSFKIIPSLNTSWKMLTSVDVKFISIVHVYREV